MRPKYDYIVALPRCLEGSSWLFIRCAGSKLRIHPASLLPPFCRACTWISPACQEQPRQGVSIYLAPYSLNCNSENLGILTVR